VPPTKTPGDLPAAGRRRSAARDRILETADRQLLMLQTGAIFGVAIDDTPGLGAIFLEAWDRLIGS
jgi:hypothetical protein